MFAKLIGALKVFDRDIQKTPTMQELRRAGLSNDIDSSWWQLNL